MSANSIFRIECDVSVVYSDKHAKKPSVTEGAFGKIVHDYLTNNGVVGKFTTTVRQPIQGKRGEKQVVIATNFDDKSIELHVQIEGPSSCYLCYLTADNDTNITDVFYLLRPEKKPCAPVITNNNQPDALPRKKVPLPPVVRHFATTIGIGGPQPSDETFIEERLPKIIATGRRAEELQSLIDVASEEKLALVNQRQEVETQIEKKKSIINALKNERDDPDFKKQLNLYRLLIGQIKSAENST